MLLFHQVPGITGYIVSEAGLTHGYIIDQPLTNSTDTVQSVTYTIIPRALTTGCADGIPEIIEIKVHPTVIQDFIQRCNFLFKYRWDY